MFSIPFNMSPYKDNGTEPFSKMFYEIGEHVGRDLYHSAIHNFSRYLIFFVCAYGLSSSIQTTGFQWGSSPEIEMAIEHLKCCGQLTISLWILMCFWGYCLAGMSTSGQVLASWQRQVGWYWYWVNDVHGVHDAVNLNKGPPDQWKQNRPITSKIHHHVLQ